MGGSLTTRIRRIVFWLHLLAGVTAGAVILIMAATGVGLAFQTQVVNWAERDLRSVKVPTNGVFLHFDTLLAKIQSAYPDSEMTAITLNSSPTSSVMMNLGRESVVYLNPYTGEILGGGSRLRGGFQTLENWHRWLGASLAHRSTGRAFTGAANFTFLFLAVSGLYLWWPRNWQSWTWRKLQPSLRPMAGLRGRTRDWNWHNATGFWCAPVLIILTLTGVIMSYQWANNLLYTWTGNPPPPVSGASATGRTGASPHRHDSADEEVAQTPQFDPMLENLRNSAPDWTTVVFRLPAHPGMPVQATVQDRHARPVFARSQWSFDASTGEILKSEPFAKQNLGRQLRTWARFLHTGEALGWYGQGIMALASLGGVILVLTGLKMAASRITGKKPAGITSDGSVSSQPN